MSIEGRYIEDHGTIVEVGDGIPDFVNAPNFTPVRFDGGTYGVLPDREATRVLTWHGPGAFELNEAITYSTTMPIVATLSSGVVRITVCDENGVKSVIRHHYGHGKEDRSDIITKIE